MDPDQTSDLDLQCFQKGTNPGSARTGLMNANESILFINKLAYM